MKSQRLTVLTLFVVLALLAPASGQVAVAQGRDGAGAASVAFPSQATLEAVRSAQGLPLMFVENVGQFDARARFQVRRSDTVIHLADDAIWFSVSKAGQQITLKLSFPGANPHTRLEPFDRLETHVSYFIGNNPDNWRADVPAWGGVRYVDLYPGVDLEIASQGGRWAWRIVGNKSQVGRPLDARLKVEGADALSLEGAEYLRLTTAVGDFLLPLLQADGIASAILPGPTIVGDQVIAPFNLQSLIPNSPSNGAPYSTFLGGEGSDAGLAIAVDGSGNAYVTGDTASTNFPTTTLVFSPTRPGGAVDAFVAKLNPAGTALVYATFLGGSGDTDSGHGIAVDGDGNVYVTGQTSSEDFPTTAGAFDTTFSGGSFDAFVVKVNTTGAALVYGAYVGGTYNEDGRGLDLDSTNKVYVAGVTNSSDFPTTSGAYDTSHNGDDDAFLVKLNLGGGGSSDLLYGAYLGSASSLEGASGVAVDGSGNAYLVGTVWGDEFPTKGTLGPTAKGNLDVFASKINPAGGGDSDLVYSGYIGSAGIENGYGIAVDGSGSAYVTGDGYPKADFSVPEGAFVVKIKADGSGMDYAASLRGTDGNQVGYGIAVDGSGNAYMTGETNSTDLPVTAGAYQAQYGGGGDAFVAKLNASGSIVYATYLGGSEREHGNGIAVDKDGNAYIVGTTKSANFPTTVNAFDTTFGGGAEGDVFVTKLALGGGQNRKVYLPVVLR